MDPFEGLRRSLPEIRTITDIRDDPSIRLQIVRIRNKPWWPIEKQVAWMQYLKGQFDSGLLAEPEFEELKAWPIEW